MIVEAALQEAVSPGNGESPFVITVPKILSPSMVARILDTWQHAWRHAGREGPAPATIVVERDTTIQSFGDAELKAHGLMRIQGD